MSRLFGVVVVGLLLCVASLGCGSSGPPSGDVTGQVTMDGQPLPNALVTFSPTEGGITSTGKTDAEGKYELHHLEGKGAVLGTHRVTVTTLQDPGTAAAMDSSDSDAYAKQAMGGSVADYNAAKVVEPIPARYNSNTQLTFEVKSGKNEYDIELQSGG